MGGVISCLYLKELILYYCNVSGKHPSYGIDSQVRAMEGGCHGPIYEGCLYGEIKASYLLGGFFRKGIKCFRKGDIQRLT